MIKLTPITRVLAIDPTTRGFAWALLEGTNTLAGHGTVYVPTPRNEKSLERVDILLASLRPDILVIEDSEAEGARRSARAAALLEAIEARAKERRVKSRRIARSRVLEAFAPQATTKHEIAISLVTHFPELRSRLPRVRKPWMSEDQRMNVFDALALAVTFVAEASGDLPVIRA